MKKLLLSLLVTLSSCTIMQNTMPTSKKKLVIVSAAPYIKIVEQLSGNLFTVQTIIPQDADPHSFEPTPKDMGALVQANLWIQVGESFESPLKKTLKESIPTLTILSLQDHTKGIKSTCNHSHKGHCHHHSIDTHYWLDPLTVAAQAKVIAKSLISISPSNKPYIESNLKSLVQDLTKLNEHLQKKLRPYKGEIFLTTHNAYGYFCHRYNLKQISIEGEDGKEIGSQDIHETLVEARTHRDKIIAVLTQPQHVNKAAYVIAEKLALHVLSINPYDQDYLKTINDLASTVKRFGKAHMSALHKEL